MRSRTKIVRVFPAALLSASLLMAIVTGCSTEPRTDYSRVRLVPAGGQVTLDGAPLPAAVVTFESLDTGTFSFALTDSKGRYRLQLDSVMPGVLPGSKVVQISTSRRLPGLNVPEDIDEAEEGIDMHSSPERVPACYNRQSQLRVEVDASSSTFNFDLRSDCSPAGPG